MGRKSIHDTIFVVDYREQIMTLSSASTIDYQSHDLSELLYYLRSVLSEPYPL